MIILNYNNARCGKTYYEMNNNWKYVKYRIKNILDEKNSIRLHKINMIIIILEDYKKRYLECIDKEKKK